MTRRGRRDVLGCHVLGVLEARWHRRGRACRTSSRCPKEGRSLSPFFSISLHDAAVAATDVTGGLAAGDDDGRAPASTRPPGLPTASSSTASSRPDPTCPTGLVSGPLFGCEPPSLGVCAAGVDCVALMSIRRPPRCPRGDASPVRHGRTDAECDGACAQPGVPGNPRLRRGTMPAALAMGAMRRRMGCHS